MKENQRRVRADRTLFSTRMMINQPNFLLSLDRLSFRQQPANSGRQGRHADGALLKVRSLDRGQEESHEQGVRFSTV